MAGNRGAALNLVGQRLRAQLLTGTPARDPVAVTERLLAVQAQDPRAARLAIRARTAGLGIADVDRALNDRSLVITWLNRGTLQLVRSEDYFWLHALTTPPLLTASATRLAHQGVSPAAAERAVEVIERSLAQEGPLNRYQLRDRLAAAGIPTDGQALIHELALASHRGIVLRGPMIGAHQAYVLVRDWLDPPQAVNRDSALAELARRYLTGHEPADDRDLAQWAGLPLRDVRAGLAAIASELVAREDGLLELSGAQRESELPAPRLLGAFETILLGWRSRESIVGPHAKSIMTGGMFRPFALVGGRAAGTWRLAAGAVSIEPFHELAPTDEAALQADAKDVLRFLGS